jgi:hypothetical protein
MRKKNGKEKCCFCLARQEHERNQAQAWSSLLNRRFVFFSEITHVYAGLRRVYQFAQVVAVCAEIKRLRSVYAVFTHCLRIVYAVFTQCLRSVWAVFTQCLRSVYAVFTQCLRSVYAVFTHCLRSVYAVFTQCLRSVCGNTCMFALCLRSYMFTQVGICLRSVYAVFTQCLRSVYADLFLFAQCGHLRKHCHFFCVFTHVYACLRI